LKSNEKVQEKYLPGPFLVQHLREALLYPPVEHVVGLVNKTGCAQVAEDSNGLRSLARMQPKVSSAEP
jgi:altronate dehydratase